MTDLAPEMTEPVVPVDAPAAEPQTVEEWKAKYQAEVQGRVKERNMYRPAQRLIGDLDEGEREALIALAELVRAGDAEAIAEWSLRTAENVTGKSRAELVAAQQAAAGQQATNIASAPEAPAPVAPDDIARIVREQLEADRQQQASVMRQQQLVESMSKQMRDAGYDPSTAAGQTIIRICRETGDMGQAIEIFRNEVLATAMTSAQAAAAAAGQVPGPAPSGSAPTSAPADNLTPRQRMENRLGMNGRTGS